MIYLVKVGRIVRCRFKKVGRIVSSSVIKKCRGYGR